MTLDKELLFNDATKAGISTEYIHLVNTYLENNIVSLDQALAMFRLKLKEIKGA